MYNQEGSRVAQLTTGADGKTAASPLLPAGTYTVREESAPAGFALAPDTSVTITSGSTATVDVADAPQNALVNLVGQKIDAETNAPYPLGSATLEGALFRVNYYDQGDIAEQASPGILGELGANSLEQASPKRSWTFKTDEAGNVAFDENHLVEGD